MTFPRGRLKLVTLVAAILVVAGASWALFKDHSHNTQTAKNQAPGSNPASPKPPPDVSQTTTIETSYFKYQKPANWAQMSKSNLDALGATSGIGRPSPTVTFTTKVSSPAPSTSAELKDSALTGLRKLSNFTLVSSADTKIDRQPGQKFTYTFSSNDGQIKLTQQLSLIPYKQKSYFLLFSSNSSDFDKSKPDFDKIETSFHFK